MQASAHRGERALRPLRRAFPIPQRSRRFTSSVPAQNLTGVTRVTTNYCIPTQPERIGRRHVGVAMREFAFKVNLIAVVRVRAADETVARQVVPTVLGAPGTAEIGLANQNNIRASGCDATVTSVDFSIGPIKPSKRL